MRVVNRPLAFILGAALGGAAVIVIIEVIAVASHHNPVVVPWTTWYRWANRTRWDQLVIQIWSAILIAIGAVILAIELKPPRVNRLPLRSRHDATDAAVARRGLAKALRAAATGIDGISAAAVIVGRRRARVTATAAARGRAAAGALRAPVPPPFGGPPARPGRAPPAEPDRTREHPEQLMHADRTNRAALIVFGLLVFAAGGAGMAASVGGFGQAFSRRTLFDNRVSAYIGHHGWVWYAAAGLCLIIVLAALLWIAILLVSTDRADDIPIPVATHEGTTILLPAALTDALTSEIGAYHGVDA